MAKETIHTAVNQLISHHTDFKSLFKEVQTFVSEPEYQLQSGYASHDLGNQCFSSYINGIVNSCKNVLQGGGGNSEDIIAASFTSQKLKELIKDESSLNHATQNEVLALMKAAKQFLQEGKFNKEYFAMSVTQDVNLPLEVIWLLHQEDLMTMEDFITSNLSRPKAIGKLAGNITEMCCTVHTTHKNRENVIKGVMNFLLMKGYFEPVDNEKPASRGLKKVSVALLDSITKKIIQQEKSKDISVYTFLLQEHTDKECLKRYCTRQLTLVLSLNHRLKVSDALMQQSKWSFAKTDAYRTQMFRELLLPFSAKEAVTILKKVLEEEEVNWETVLSFTATLLVCYDEAPKLLQVLSVELINEALEKCELDGLIVGFLLARQSAIEGPHVFQTYQQWFYMTFGEQQTSPANNKKAFTFLIKFFSDIVPYETAQHLKAHIMKPPYIPPKCRPLLSDYITLAKTRLLDLKEPIDQASIYAETTEQGNSVNTLHEQAKIDVEKALNSFSKSGKIPASVMEASIFRKPYFIARFLPALLKPRPLPEYPDNKMGFIEALIKSDKIPQSMYTTYTTACKNIASQLLEGIFSDTEDENMDDMLLSPWQQFEKCLETIESLVMRCNSEVKREQTAPSLVSQISVLYEKLNVVLSIDDHSQQLDGIQELCFNINQPALNVSYIKAVDRILSSVSKILIGTSCVNNKWLSQILLSICRNTEVYKTLCVHLWYMVCVQGTELNESQTHCIASVCVVLFNDATLSTVNVKLNDDHMLLQHALFSYLNYSTKLWILFTLRFVTYYLESVFATLPEATDLSSEITNIFIFLVKRAQFSQLFGRRKEYIDSLKTAQTIHNSSHFQQMSYNQFKLQDWIGMEVKMDPSDDMFCENSRQRYYDTMIFTEFQPPQTSQKSTWAEHFCTTIACHLIKADKIAVPSQCCHNNGKFIQRYESPSRSHLVCLLQRLTQYLTVGKPDTPWLIKWYKHIQKEESTTKDIDLYSALKLGGQLSPYLLFVNSLQPHDSIDLHSTIEFINDTYKELESEGAVLNVHTTMYVLQSVISIQHQPVMWAELFHQCPLLIVSIQYHLASVELWITWIKLRSQLSDQFEKMKEISNKSKILLSESNVDLNSIEHTDSILLAAALICCIQSSEHVPRDLANKLMKHPSIVTSVIQFALGNLSWQLAYSSIFKHEMVQLLKKLFMMIPESFVTVENTVKKLCPAANISLWPVVILKVLQASGGEDIDEVWSNHVCLTVLLKCYTECTNLYERTFQKTEKSVAQFMMEPLSLKSLQQYFSWIKHHITKVPGTVLMLLDKNVVECCDPDIKRLIKERCRSF